MTGFLEESPGVRSMARLAILILSILTAAVVAVICIYALRPSPDAEVVGALAGVLAALVLNGIVALAKRGSGE